MKKVHGILASNKMTSTFEEEEQVIEEQPIEKPTTPIASPTPTEDRNSPPSFLKERKE